MAEPALMPAGPDAARPGGVRCVLHIGTEKTATTLLQRWLYENEAALSEQGVALTHGAHAPNNRKLASYLGTGFDDFLQAQNVFSDAEKAAYFEGFERGLTDEIRRLCASHHTVVLTSEHFHSHLRERAQIDRLREMLAPLFDEFEVVCYFREQSKVRTSKYSTSLKGRGTQTVEEFHSDAGLDSHFYNYLLFFGKWEAAFGKRALRPRIFLKDRLVEGDVRRDFLATALPDVDADRLDFATASANESLPRDLAEIFRVINAARPRYAGRFKDPTRALVKGIVAEMKFLRRSPPIFDPRQTAMYETFSQSNAEFASRYLSEEANPFPPPAGDAAPPAPSSFGIRHIAIVVKRILANRQLIVLKRPEGTLCLDLIERLHPAGHISKREAIALARIVARSRPGDERVAALLDRLHRAD